MLPLSELQAAIYDALKPALDPVPVLDYAGPNQVFPYVTIGESISEEVDTLNNQAIDIEITVHVWSRQAGMKQCQDLMTSAKDALDRKKFPVTGFQWVDTIWIYAQTLREPDGETRHGILRFRIPTFAAPIVGAVGDRVVNAGDAKSSTIEFKEIASEVYNDGKIYR